MPLTLSLRRDLDRHRDKRRVTLPWSHPLRRQQCRQCALERVGVLFSPIVTISSDRERCAVYLTAPCTFFIGILVYVSRSSSALLDYTDQASSVLQIVFPIMFFFSYSGCSDTLVLLRNRSPAQSSWPTTLANFQRLEQKWLSVFADLPWNAAWRLLVYPSAYSNLYISFWYFSSLPATLERTSWAHSSPVTSFCEWSILAWSLRSLECNAGVRRSSSSTVARSAFSSLIRSPALH